MSEIYMPRLSDTMEEGVISSWVKQVGDKVSVGDVLVEIETDKAVMEYEAYEDGYLVQQTVREGETVPIGAVIGVIADSPDAVPAAPTAGIPPSRRRNRSSSPSLRPGKRKKNSPRFRRRPHRQSRTANRVRSPRHWLAGWPANTVSTSPRSKGRVLKAE